MSWNVAVVPKKNPKSPNSPKEKVKGLLDLVADNWRGDNSYKPQIRFSKFPVCGLLFAKEVLDERKLKKVHFSQDFFTTIGHAVHGNWQHHAPLTENVKEHVFGNWKCLKCNEITVKLSTTPHNLICPKCRSNEATLIYDEIEVDYKGVKGHIDLMFFYNDEYYLVDWKTTSQSNIDDPSKYLPHNKHLMQIECYIYALLHQFDLQVSHYCLEYVARDSTNMPDAYVNKTHRWMYFRSTTPEMLKIRKEQLEHGVRTKRQVKAFLGNKTVKSLRDLENNRPCHSRKDYNNPQTGMANAFVGKSCPYLGSCCSGDKWTKIAKTLWKEIREE